MLTATAARKSFAGMKKLAGPAPRSEADAIAFATQLGALFNRPAYVYADVNANEFAHSLTMPILPLGHWARRINLTGGTEWVAGGSPAR